MKYDITKFNSGDCAVCFGDSSLLSKVEIWTQKLEVIREKLPKDTKVATHVRCIVGIPETRVITRKKYFGWVTETHTLTPGVYIFEEKGYGIEFGLLKDRIADTDVFMQPVTAFSETAQKAFTEAIISHWVWSVSYGWKSFLVEPLYSAFGWFAKMKATNWEEICSELYADCINQTCDVDKVEHFFSDTAVVNPLEVSINKFLQVKTF